MPFGTIHQIIVLYKTIVVTINIDNRRQNDRYGTLLALALSLNKSAWLGGIAGGSDTLTVVRSNWGLLLSNGYVFF
jgi:L-cystine uptake protein TcyP (sodium:dicarboxylate symporter family)